MSQNINTKRIFFFVLSWYCFVSSDVCRENFTLRSWCEMTSR